ncbi:MULTISPECIES: HpcH/HpaI aldolase family protein [Halocynthiibacter]|uniref:HpcH/HpaI aldolase/citrate lyase family protein n=1 Tax=Halocynthiibacter halioticoli TaxID=2986804 RepID=A0AAE3J0W7_9RHOB|nr:MULTISPECIES: HpcH/HpaI aldolase/citrate lyase family protein [Halocynthiibacter]MCV6824466.1 HpcH/HpaI aldolase/citrate lyase family protein [Halocynthiibacter halioticoli]MCW4057467.1 HpcH/HpaI aldolase/citrate lyase family protein [Halocynthiibacter sp. SDUM655004]
MPAPENALLRNLRSGNQQFGVWVGATSATVAEIIARVGLDWVVVDMEHAPNDLRSLRDQLRAFAIGETHVAVRLVADRDWMVKQVLDLGVQTVLVPMVETAEQAEKIARAMRYAPRGNRGVGAFVARAGGYGETPDYMSNANDEVALMVQIETRRGLDNLDDILSVDGVDAVFFGVADLATDMGLMGPNGADTTHPDLLDALNAAAEKVRAAQKPIGVFAASVEHALSYASLDAKFICIGSDVLMIREAFASRLEEAKQKFAD